MTLESFEIGSVFTGTGTAASTAASKAVTGSSSSFTTEFAAGYLIIIAGETRIVDTVTDNTNLTVTENFTTGSGGQVAYTGVNLINVELLTTRLDPPRSTWVEFSTPIELMDGTVRGGGWTTTTWTWDFMTQTQRTQIKSFCSGKSADDVYIKTKKEDETFQIYSCIMVWPDHTARRNSKVLELVISFRNMTVVSTS